MTGSAGRVSHSVAFVLLTLTVTSRYVITFLFLSKQTLSKAIQLTPDCGKPTAINRNSVIDQFLTDLAPLSDREYWPAICESIKSPNFPQ